MLFLLLSFVVPVAGVSLLQVDRRPSGRVVLGGPRGALPPRPGLMLLEEEDKETVELLRFVTPYKTPLEAIVEISPYSQLMKALIASGPVEFYVAIDTWDSNDTRSKSLYVSNVSDSCSVQWSSQGNAWNVSLDFVQWPRVLAAGAAVQPRKTILLAESFPNPLLAIGEVKAYEGILKGDHVILSSDATLTPSASIYACPAGVAALKKDANLGAIAQEAEQMVLEEDEINDTVLENISLTVQALHLEEIVNDDMITARILKADEKTKDFEILLKSNATLTKNMPVYLTGASSDKPYTATVWFNMSLPFLPMGYIKEVFNKTHALMNVTKHHCIFSLNRSSLPSLLLPRDEHVIHRGAELLRQLAQHGIRRGQRRRGAGGAAEVLLILNQTGLDDDIAVQEIKPLGRITSEANGVENSTGTKVCVVQKNTQGHVITRHFHPSLQADERALLHLTITGHGWAATSESCGEYCHAVYHLHLNGKNFANVTNWRDDCYLNPGGPAQHGTWYESRNGWCPGSVEPGIYIDITDHLEKSSPNDFTLSLTVWQNLTHRYAPYTDISGFVQQDTAMLALTANVLVYEPAAVSAALDAPKAFSKAEQALRQGCSDPERLKPPKVVHFLSDDFTSSKKARQENKEQVIDTYPPGAVPFDFETRSPWYFYNHSAETLPGATAGAKYLPVIQNRLVQINSRTVYGDVDASKFETDWQQLALRFRLMYPSDLEMDHWDRVGSMGVMIPKTGLPNVQSHTSEADSETPSASKYWRWSK